MVTNGFKYTGKRMPFTWELIKLLIKAFDQKIKARIVLFLIACWAFLFRPLSEAFQMQVGDERDTGSLPADKHFGMLVDPDNRANLRLLKRKHRPRGSFMQRIHTCFGDRHKVFCCLPCRLQVALKELKYGDPLFEEKPADMMRIIKSQSQALCIQANNLTWKSFRVGHATHLAWMATK